MLADVALALTEEDRMICRPVGASDGCGTAVVNTAALEARIAELENAIREMVASVPGGEYCDPQEVCDDLREIAEKHGVRTET